MREHYSDSVRVPQLARVGSVVGALKQFVRPDRTGLTAVGAGLVVYSMSAILLALRAPTVLGSKWSWLAVLAIPAVTLLIACLRTGTALALVLVYAFALVTFMAIQSYRNGWDELTQASYVFSHLSLIFFLGSTVALTTFMRSRHAALAHAQELVSRYVMQDETTGLLTNAAFMAAAERELGRSCRTARPFVLLSIDMSGYFEAGRGSASLGSGRLKIADLLSCQTREGQDLWTMWSEDVYLGLLVETDAQAVEPVSTRVLERLTTAPEFCGQELVDRARFSVASYPVDGISMESLVAHAIENGQPLEHLLLQVNTPITVKERLSGTKALVK